MKRTVLSLTGLLLACSAAFAGVPPPSTPEPGTFVLLATAVAGGGGYFAWRRLRKK